MGLFGSERDIATRKSVQRGTKRDQKGPAGTTPTGLQNRGLQVELRSAYGRSSLCSAVASATAAVATATARNSSPAGPVKAVVSPDEDYVNGGSDVHLIVPMRWHLDIRVCQN